MFALLLLVAALPPPPPAPVVETAEETALGRREVVVRPGAGSAPGAASAMAMVDVAAAPSRVIQAAVDLEPRLHEVGGFKDLQVYLREPGRIGARWEAGVLGFTSTFHVVYEYDLALGWCVYALDTSRPNDLEAVSGSYHAVPHGSGSRLVYRASSSTSAPEWVREWLASTSARELLNGIRRRAEAPVVP